MSQLCVGVDVGGTLIKAGLVDEAGQVLAEARRDTPGRTAGPGQVEDTIVAVVDELLARPLPATSGTSSTHGAASTHGVAAVGVGAAGLVDTGRGTVVFAPHLSWRQEPLRDRLGTRLGLPVLVDNDAHAAAWAAHRFGAGRGESHLLVITLGTGIGGAILTEGRLQRGRHGLARELGHVRVVPDGRACECGNEGCWEQYVSGSVVRRQGQELVRLGRPEAAALAAACADDPAALRGEDVTRLARDGDPASLEILADAGRWLGRGLAGAVATLDPGTVVVGGGLSHAGELLLGPARAELARHLLGRRYRPEPRVVAARLGVGAGLVGAAELARTAVPTRTGTVADGRSRATSRPATTGPDAAPGQG